MLKFMNRLITTGFFIGNIPGAPGTYGSLLGAFFIALYPHLTNLWYIIIILFFVGVLTSTYEEKVTHIEDDPQIILDEIVGILITFISIPFSWVSLIIGFILFRIFDILKPQPIKVIQKLPYGWGIMADDLLAGIAAQIVLRFLLIIIK